MTPVKATLVSLFMLTGIAMWGAALYSADAAGDHGPVNGYGVGYGVGYSGGYGLVEAD